MLSSTFATLFSAIFLASAVSATPLQATPTEHSVAKRQGGDPLDVTVLAFAQVSALGAQVSARCLTVQVAADADLPTVQNAVTAAANIGLTGLQVVTTTICAAANNRVPTCNGATGCGAGLCLPGFQEDVAGNCVPVVVTNPALDSTVLAAVQVNLGGLVGITTQCIAANVAADAGLTAIQNAVVTQAQADLGVADVADVDLCLAVNNRIPTCDPVNGCSLAGCAPGFVLDTTTNTCIVPPPTPSTRRRRRNLQRRSLCPSPNETACSLSGSSKLSNSAVVSHQYECLDLSSSIEACGACGNVCIGASQGCQDGICVDLK